jgi:hypothetical protein
MRSLKHKTFGLAVPWNVTTDLDRHAVHSSKEGSSDTAVQFPRVKVEKYCLPLPLQAIVY